MTDIVQLHSTRCPICHTEGNATELYPANFDAAAFNVAVFSARRLPDRLHYRMVKCNTCGLVRSDPIADLAVLSELYARSTCDYTDEIPNIKRTYGDYLANLSRYGAHKGSLLEIGCGNGFFLEEALAQGYERVYGVEPSKVAVAQAHPRLQPNIVCDVMHPGLFMSEQFDAVCLFQVLDHLPDPAELISESFRLIKPGGFILALNHNAEAISARLLRDRSPIIDLEHTFLYSPATMSRIFGEHGFQVKCTGSVWNTYALTYLIRLVPLPSGLKRILLVLLGNTFVGRFRLSVPLGNVYLIAQKPENFGISSTRQD